MKHPDDAVNISFALGGNVQDKPDQIISVVVTNKDNEPEGLLERWGASAWIYADTDVLEDLN